MNEKWNEWNCTYVHMYGIVHDPIELNTVKQTLDILSMFW